MSNLFTYYKDIIKNEPFPLLFLDIDKFKENITQIGNRRSNDKLIRIASKSIRSLSLIKMILTDYPDVFQGVLAYSGNEAVFLSQNGIRNIVVAYPIVNINEITNVCNQIKVGGDITLMVDNNEQINKINNIGEKIGVRIPLCLDIDMSSKFIALHFGVLRSPITKSDQALEVANTIKNLPNVELNGVMGYEAQIAGVPDRSPAKNFFLNFIIRRLKSRSIKRIRKRRLQIITTLKDEGFNLKFVNGGGTGSVESTTEESIVTEVTVGSGFFSSHLFDYYDNFKHHPSLLYAIQITRIPKKGIYTCHGGGYVASGSLGIDKIPKPFLPEGSKLLVNEMAGEVQTPIQYKGEETLQIGDPIIMRHSKAGEVCEHFDEILIIKDGIINDRVKTYRGEGKIFL